MKERLRRLRALWGFGWAICPAALLAIAAFAAPSPSSAQTTLDVSIFHTDRDTFAEAFRQWASSVERQTEGRLRLRGHYAGSLVSITETLNAVRDGVVPI